MLLSSNMLSFSFETPKHLIDADAVRVLFDLFAEDDNRT